MHLHSGKNYRLRTIDNTIITSTHWQPTWLHVFLLCVLSNVLCLVNGQVKLLYLVSIRVHTVRCRSLIKLSVRFIFSISVFTSATSIAVTRCIIANNEPTPAGWMVWMIVLSRDSNPGPLDSFAVTHHSVQPKPFGHSDKPHMLHIKVRHFLNSRFDAVITHEVRTYFLKTKNLR
jgi:hypothetical protein